MSTLRRAAALAAATAIISTSIAGVASAQERSGGDDSPSSKTTVTTKLAGRLADLDSTNVGAFDSTTARVKIVDKAKGDSIRVELRGIGVAPKEHKAHGKKPKAEPVATLRLFNGTCAAGDVAALGDSFVAPEAATRKQVKEVDQPFFAKKGKARIDVRIGSLPTDGSYSLVVANQNGPVACFGVDTVKPAPTPGDDGGHGDDD